MQKKNMTWTQGDVMILRNRKWEAGVQKLNLLLAFSSPTLKGTPSVSPRKQKKHDSPKHRKNCRCFPAVQVNPVTIVSMVGR